MKVPQEYLDKLNASNGFTPEGNPVNTQRVEGHTQAYKSCPFCGEDAEEVPKEKGKAPPRVRCSNRGCALVMATMTSIEWNRRASIERLEKVNEALVRALENCVANMRGIMNETDIASVVICNQAEATLKLAKEPA